MFLLVLFPSGGVVFDFRTEMLRASHTKMVCLKGDTISSDSLENVIGQKTKNVNIDGELVQVAKKIGITFAE